MLLWLSLALAAILLYLTLRGQDWTAFWMALKNGHYGFLLLTMPIASLSYFIRALRWNLLVRSEARIPVIPVFWANMVGYMGNAYLPARAGEIMRSAILGQRRGLGTSFVLATALSERTLDAVTLVLFGSAALLSRRQIPPPLAVGLRAMALAAFLGLAFILTAPFQQVQILRIAEWVPLPERWSRMLSRQTVRFLAGMRSLQNLRRMLAFMVLTGVIWLIDSLTAGLAAQIISRTLNLGQALILLAALGLSSAIPSTPGYVGIYQFVAVIVLVPFGYSRAEALAYSLVSQVVNYAVVSFWGTLGLWRLNPWKGIVDLRKRQN